MDRCIEQPLAPTLDALAVPRILLDVGDHTGVENALAIVGGIKAAVFFNACRPSGNSTMSVSLTGATVTGANTEP